MPKDRNTVSKKVSRKNSTTAASASGKAKKIQANTAKTSSVKGVEPEEAALFSDEEIRVFAFFRRYLMSPGQMLCFSSQDLESLKKGFEKLVARDMLVPEGSRGGYYLTAEGFEAMKLIPEK